MYSSVQDCSEVSVGWFLVFLLRSWCSVSAWRYVLKKLYFRMIWLSLDLQDVSCPSPNVHLLALIKFWKLLSCSDSFSVLCSDLWNTSWTCVGPLVTHLSVSVLLWSCIPLMILVFLLYSFCEVAVFLHIPGMLYLYLPGVGLSCGFFPCVVCMDRERPIRRNSFSWLSLVSWTV